ncbi:unnamed protein product [Parajaminaea phylloscopi]
MVHSRDPSSSSSRPAIQPSDAASSSSSPSSAASQEGQGTENPYLHNTIDYTLDHTRAHSPVKPDSAAELALSADTRAQAEDAMRACAVQILEQPIEMLRSGVVQDRELSTQSQGVSGSTVGKHLRHVLDHFRLFLDSLESSPAESVPLIDYDRRLRAVPIETSSKAALDEFVHTQERVKRVLKTSPSDRGPIMERPVILQATTPIIQEFRSTIGREIWFICLHSIHHFALARVVLKELGVSDQISAEFGVAPSTLVYRSWGRAQDRESKKPQAKL